MLPLIITNDDPDNIKSYIRSILRHPDLDAIFFTAPYISEYFVEMLLYSNAKLITVIINRNSPQYVLDAMKQLLMLDYRNILKEYANNEVPFPYQKSVELRRKIIIRQRADTKFVHMKALIPYFRDRKSNKLYPKYVLTGSVNWTKGGVEGNDELLIVLRDEQSIKKIAAVINRLLKNTIDYGAASR